MSKSNVPRKQNQKTKAAAKASAAELAARRARTLLVLQASKAAIEGYRDLVARECDAALELLSKLEPFAYGAQPPVLVERFAAALRASSSTDEGTHEDGVGQLCKLTDATWRVALAETAVTEAYAQAAGVCETPIEISLRRIRDDLDRHNPGTSGLRDLERSFRAPLGGSESHRRAVGASPEHSDQFVMVSSDQWLMLDGRKREQKGVGHA